MLEFDPGPHVYRMNGIVVPSVTKVIYSRNPIKAKDGRPIPGFVLQQAAAIGTTVHNWIEDYRQAQDCFLPEPMEPDHPKAQSAIKAFKKWEWDLSGKYKNVEWVWQEQLLYCDENDQPYSGQADALLRLDGKQVLVDFKTSKELDTRYDWQIAAYHRAMVLEGLMVDEAWLVRLDKTTGLPEIKMLIDDDLSENYSIFKEKLNEYYQLRKEQEEASKVPGPDPEQENPESN